MKPEIVILTEYHFWRAISSSANPFSFLSYRRTAVIFRNGLVEGDKLIFQIAPSTTMLRIQRGGEDLPVEGVSCRLITMQELKLMSSEYACSLACIIRQLMAASAKLRVILLKIQHAYGERNRRMLTDIKTAPHLRVASKMERTEPVQFWNEPFDTSQRKSRDYYWSQREGARDLRQRRAPKLDWSMSL